MQLRGRAFFVFLVLLVFTVASPLGSNVDAGLAALRPGAMNSIGFIEDVGTISSIPATPSGAVGSVNTSVNVQYQRGCGKGKKFIVSSTGQVVIDACHHMRNGSAGGGGHRGIERH